MFVVRVPVVVVPTTEAAVSLGVLAGPAAGAAFREIAITGRSLEIAHLQFGFKGRTLAICSRVRRSGVVEIELGQGDPRLPASVFTEQQMRAAERAAMRPSRDAGRSVRR